jgi:hypothetical protein
MSQKQVVSIYRERKSGDFHLQPFGRLANGSSQPFGRQQHLSGTVTDGELMIAILESLAKNDEQFYDRSLVERTPWDEEKSVYSQQKLISIYKSDRECRIIPFRRMGNSFGSIDDMIQVVSSEEFLKRGGEIIRQLFEEIP